MHLEHPSTPLRLPAWSGPRHSHANCAPHSSPCRIVKLVRALRKGWIKREAAPEKPDTYLIWEDDGGWGLGGWALGLGGLSDRVTVCGGGQVGENDWRTGPRGI